MVLEDVQDLDSRRDAGVGFESGALVVDENNHGVLPLGHVVDGAFEAEYKVENLSLRRFRVDTTRAHGDDGSAINVEAVKDAVVGQSARLTRMSGKVSYILPESFSILTSSADIRSGLYSRLHSMVPLIRFLPSSSFHFAARMYRAGHSGSSIHRRSLG